MRAKKEENILKKIDNQLQLRVSNLEEINKALEENTRKNKKKVHNLTKLNEVILKRKAENQLQGKESPEKSSSKIRRQQNRSTPYSRFQWKGPRT